MIAAASDPGSDGPARLIAIDGTAETAPPDARSLQQALDVAQKRLQDALAQSAYWHEQRISLRRSATSCLASAIDFSASAGINVIRPKALDRARQPGGRAQSACDRGETSLPPSVSFCRAKWGPSLLAEAEARWNAERESWCASAISYSPALIEWPKQSRVVTVSRPRCLLKRNAPARTAQTGDGQDAAASERERLVDDQRRRPMRKNVLRLSKSDWPTNKIG